MIDLKLSPEHKMARESARKWLAKELEPHLEKMDNHEMLPFDLVKRFAREITGSANVETVEDLEAQFGSPDFLMRILLGIEVAKVSPGFAMAMGATYSLTSYSIVHDGTTGQKKKFALPLARHDKIGSLAITEPEAGSDVMGMKSRAVRDGDNFILNGSKTFITNAPYADIFVYYAKTDKGITAFILERGMDGLTTGKPMDKMGMRASPTGEIFCEDVKVPVENVLGEEGQGFMNCLAVLQNERAYSPCMGIGIMERCIEIALRYSKQRIQFGRPICSFQGMQFKMARMWEALQTSYALLFMLGQLKAQGLDISIPASAAKLYSSEKATQVALDAVQILGGYGYMKEYKVERFVRDAKLMEIGAGTSEIQCLIMGRKLVDTDEPELNPLFAGPDPFAR